MKNLTYLAESVERSRLNAVISFDTNAACLRGQELEQANAWAPEIRVEHLGADKYILLITADSRFGCHFNNQFTVSHVKEIYLARPLSDSVLYVRCQKPTGWVKEEVIMGFLPF
jgi:hypothetical protein